MNRVVVPIVSRFLSLFIVLASAYIFLRMGMFDLKYGNLIPLFFTWFFLSRIITVVLGGKTRFGLGGQDVVLIKGDYESYYSVVILLVVYIPVCVMFFYFSLRIV